jgi:hypothetical protein
LFERITYIVFLPAALIVRATIPTVDDETYNRCGGWRSCHARAPRLPHGPCRFFSIITPLCAGLFLLAGTGNIGSTIGSGFPAWALVLLLGVALGVVVFMTTRTAGPPRFYIVRAPLMAGGGTGSDGSEEQFFVPVAFVLSVMWVYVVANELVSLLQVRACRCGTFGAPWC